jgi:hypothetical protein
MRISQKKRQNKYNFIQYPLYLVGFFPFLTLELLRSRHLHTRLSGSRLGDSALVTGVELYSRIGTTRNEH